MTVSFVLIVTFWICAGVLFYTYLGYPLVVWAAARLFGRMVQRGEFEPTVTVVITAYNEERDLRGKLENTLRLDYPPEKLEILVASDCSSDRTDDIAREFARRGVRLHRQSERAGKTSAQNQAVKLAANEIILFSDATTMYQPDVLRVMLPNFADESVGCVAGKLVYVDPNRTGVGDGARGYWSYETFIKTNESLVCSLIGVSGCLYAVRRANYVPMYPEACSDFLIATKLYEQGLRTVYEPRAVSYEETNTQTAKEMRMRVRIITQTYTDLWRHRRMLNPLKSGFYAVELISHKILRYAAPLFLIALLIVSIGLAAENRFYLAIAGAQIVFYLVAALGWVFERGGVRSKILALPFYFILANAAAVVALYKFWRGERFAVWQPIRGQQQQTAGNRRTTGEFSRASSD